MKYTMETAYEQYKESGLEAMIVGYDENGKEIFGERLSKWAYGIIENYLKQKAGE